MTNYDIIAQYERKWLEPNEDTRPVVCTCDECGEDIYEDDEMYEIGGHKYCQTCIEDAHTYAEIA